MIHFYTPYLFDLAVQSERERIVQQQQGGSIATAAAIPEPDDESEEPMSIDTQAVEVQTDHTWLEAEKAERIAASTMSSMTVLYDEGLYQ